MRARRRSGDTPDLSAHAVTCSVGMPIASMNRASTRPKAVLLISAVVMRAPLVGLASIRTVGPCSIIGLPPTVRASGCSQHPRGRLLSDAVILMTYTSFVNLLLYILHT